MSSDMQQDGQLDGDAAEAGADGLGDALAGEETAFVTAEEKKTVGRGTLLMFGVLLAAGCGMYLMYMRSGPQPAGAATSEAAAADETINEFLSAGGQNIRSMQEMLRNTEKVVQQFLKYPSTTQVPLTDLKTNPFRHASLKIDDKNAVTDTKRRKEEERQVALKAVQSLALQSVMHSDARKACMINNTLYQEGQQVDSFTIERIKPNAVIVKRDVYRFELRMQR